MIWGIVLAALVVAEPGSKPAANLMLPDFDEAVVTVELGATPSPAASRLVLRDLKGTQLFSNGAVTPTNVSYRLVCESGSRRLLQPVFLAKADVAGRVTFEPRGIGCSLDTGNDVHVWDRGSATPPGLKVANHDDVAHDVTVKAKVVRRDGAVLFDGAGEWRLKGGAAARLDFPRPDANGIYEVSYSVAKDGRAILERAENDVRFAVMKPTGPFAQKHDLDPRHFLFGVCAHPLRHAAHVQRKAALAAGLCGARHLRGSLSWGEHNPAPGVFDWRKSDAFLEMMDEVNVEWQTHFGYTPRWAAAADAEAKRTSSPTARKRGMPLPDLKAYEAYVRALVTHYKGRMRIYESWNEPDINFFADFPIADYVAMQKVCYRTVKSIDPSAIVETAGFANSHAEPWIDALLKDAPDSFDYVAWHGHGPFASYLPGVGMLKSKLHQYGVKKPWIANETALSDPDEHVLAQHLPEKIVYSWANGACGYAWFRLFNNEKRLTSAESHFAMISYDFYPKEPYLAYNMLTGLLTDARYAGEPGFAGDLWCYRFETKEAALLTMWDNSGLYLRRELVFETDARAAELVDLFGNVRAVSVKNGKVAVPVGVDFETLRLMPATAKVALVDQRLERKPCETAVVRDDQKAFWQQALACGSRAQVKVLVASEPSKAHLVWAGNNDLSYDVKFHHALSGKALQMMITVRDDVHTNGWSGKVMYRGDSLQVKMLFPSQREVWEIFAAETDGGVRQTHVWSAPSGVDREAVNSQIRFNTAHFSKKNRHFMQYTFCIPYAALGIAEKDLTDGFAINVTANDDDGEGRESMMTLAGGHDSAPDRWPRVMFDKGQITQPQQKGESR